MHTKVKGDVQEMERAHLEREIAQIRRRSVWRTVEVGTLTAGELVERIEHRGCRVGNRVKKFIVPRMHAALSPRTARLCDVTVKDLEGGKDLDAEAVYAAGAQWGLHLCEPEVGFRVMLNMVDELGHLQDEWIRLAMKPLYTEFYENGSGKMLSVLFLNRDQRGEFHLGVAQANPGVVWGRERRIIFELPD